MCIVERLLVDVVPQRCLTQKRTNCDCNQNVENLWWNWSWGIDFFFLYIGLFSSNFFLFSFVFSWLVWTYFQLSGLWCLHSEHTLHKVDRCREYKHKLSEWTHEQAKSSVLTVWKEITRVCFWKTPSFWDLPISKSLVWPSMMVSILSVRPVPFCHRLMITVARSISPWHICFSKCWSNCLLDKIHSV